MHFTRFFIIIVPMPVVFIIATYLKFHVYQGIVKWNENLLFFAVMQLAHLRLDANLFQPATQLRVIIREKMEKTLQSATKNCILATWTRVVENVGPTHLWRHKCSVFFISFAHVVATSKLMLLIQQIEFVIFVLDAFCKYDFDVSSSCRIMFVDVRR